MNPLLTFDSRNSKMDTPYATTIEERVHSTQDYARTEFLARGAKTPVLTIAESQDAGRGRTGHEWWNSPRSMLASLAVASPDTPHLTLVPLMAGMAAHDAIVGQLGIATDLKWPNDILLGEDKVGGVLAEISNGTLVVGCGLNVHWPDAPADTAALLQDDPGQALSVALAHDWAGRVLAALPALPDSFERTRYIELCDTVGRDITWQPDGAGRAIGIGPDGELLVTTDGGALALHSGEVSHVRAATMLPDQESGS